jgi:SYP7 family syntaxin
MSQPREQLTAVHHEQLQQIAAEKAKQDVIIGQIGCGVDQLHHVALAMGDELDLQGRMIGDLDVHLTGTQVTMDSTNQRVTAARETMGSRSWGIYCCLLIILCVVIATLLYFIIRGEKLTI